MLSSTSEEKFQSDKKPKKKSQTFKGYLEKDTAVGKAANPAIRNETTKESGGFVDLKDFPELKSSGRQDRKLFFETRGSRVKSNKPCISDVSTGDERQINEAFHALLNTKDLKQNDTVIIKKDNASQQLVPENVASASTNVAGAGKQTNQKQNKDIKKTLGQPQRNPNKKKRSDPLFINFEDILSTNKIQKKADRRQHKILRNNVQRLKEKELLSGNFLDSCNPKRNKGKHREIKKKKLSNLKLAIVKERIIKSKIREKTFAAQFGSSSINLLDKIDFNAEIKIYLNELNEKKLKNLENKKAKIREKVDAEKINTENQESIGTKVFDKEESLKNIPHVKEKVIPHTTAEGEIRFSSKFREYCDNIITPDLNFAITKFIEELIKLQDRIFLKNPIKAKARKRHVSGIREVRKYLNLKKVKMIIIAPNLEKLQMEGSVYDSINELKSMADEQNVPYGFALDRYKLGRCTKKNVPVSAFAVLSYEGIEALYETALQELVEAKRKFSELIKPKAEENSEDVSAKMLSILVSAFKEVVQVSKEAPSEVN